MSDQRHRILTRAKTEQRKGNAGKAMILYLLASELPTMRFGDEVVHGPGDVR